MTTLLRILTAVLATIAGRGDVAAECKLKDLHIWVFHGDRDDVVPMARDYDMVQAVRRCGDTPRLTIYPDIGNASWVPAYDDTALYQWLLEHRRPAK